MTDPARVVLLFDNCCAAACKEETAVRAPLFRSVVFCSLSITCERSQSRGECTKVWGAKCA